MKLKVKFILRQHFSLAMNLWNQISYVLPKCSGGTDIGMFLLEKGVMGPNKSGLYQDKLHWILGLKTNCLWCHVPTWLMKSHLHVSAWRSWIYCSVGRSHISSINWMRSIHIREGNLLYSPSKLEMLISCRNTLTDTPRIKITKCLGPPWSSQVNTKIYHQHTTPQVSVTGLRDGEQN